MGFHIYIRRWGCHNEWASLKPRSESDPLAFPGLAANSVVILENRAFAMIFSISSVRWFTSLW